MNRSSAIIRDEFFRIKYQDVGVIARPKITPMIEPENIGREAGGAANEIVQPDHMPLFNINLILLREGGVLAGMAIGAVRTCHHPRLLHEGFHIAFNHVEGHDAVAMF